MAESQIMSKKYHDTISIYFLGGRIPNIIESYFVTAETDEFLKYITYIYRCFESFELS